MGADLLHHAHLVGDDHHGDAQLAVDVLNQLQDLPGGFGVQGAGGLVAQQHLGIGGQSPGDGNALLLTAGELRGIGLGLVRQPHQLQQLPGLGLGLLPAHPGQLHGEADVLQTGALHQQVEPLEDHGDLPPGRPQLGRGHGVQLLAVDDDPALRGPLQHIDAADQRALACAAHADDAIDIPVGDGQGHVLQGVHPPAGVFKGLADML